MNDLFCVGAFIRDGRNRVYVHRRSPGRRVFPGVWDVVGGHLEPGESPEDGLAREIEEETGWTLRRVEAVIAEWDWEHDGVVRHELDYLVEVDGDLGAPTLEQGKHDAYAWVGADNLELMMQGRTDGDRRLRDIVAKVVRVRITERLRLEPIGPEHASDLLVLHRDPAVARWWGTWSADEAERFARRARELWEADGVHKWIAYDRRTGGMVGRGGLSIWTSDPDKRPEVGWSVRGDLWGRGYATEIGRAGLTYAFDELRADEVVAFTEPHNERSRAVMERLGMRYSHDIVHNGDPFVLYRVSRPRG